MITVLIEALLMPSDELRNSRSIAEIYEIVTAQPEFSLYQSILIKGITASTIRAGIKQIMKFDEFNNENTLDIAMQLCNLAAELELDRVRNRILQHLLAVYLIRLAHKYLKTMRQYKYKEFKKLIINNMYDEKQTDINRIAVLLSNMVATYKYMIKQSSVEDAFEGRYVYFFT